MIARLFPSLLILLLLALPLPVFAAPITAALAPGLNVVGVTAPLAADSGTAFSLLATWQESGVTAIETYDANSATLLRAELDGAGNPGGTDFPLIENRALYVHSTQANTLSLGEPSSCASLNLEVGFNLVSHNCFPLDYLASEFITSVGLTNITSLSRLDLSSGRWQTIAVDGGEIVGVDFPLVAGEGYLLHTVTGSDWSSPLAAAIDLSPLTLVTGLNFTYQLTVHLSALAPAGGYPVTLTAAPEGLVNLPASLLIPAGTSSAQVTVNATALGTATISATSPGWEGSAVHRVTIRPTQSATYSSLLSSQIGIQVGPVATAPTSFSPTYTPVTSSQVGVQVGPVFTGPSPIQTRDYGPLTSAPVGIMVESAAGSTDASVIYSPIVTTEVGVAVGPVITGLAPNHGAIGDTVLELTLTGFGLDAVTGVTFIPATGITVGTLSVAPDGLSVAFPIDIAANAVLGSRTILLTTSTGFIPASVARANLFTITLPIPEIESITPLRGMVGQNFILTVNGQNFTSASSVNFNLPNGIIVNNPPTVSADGRKVTVNCSIAVNAPTGSRVVSVTTPGGTTSPLSAVTNTFNVTAANDPGVNYNSVSTMVGVMVETPGADPTRDVAYGPIVSQPVGVTVGSTLISIAPISGAIGESNLKVRALGVGLDSATALSFYPADGITIRPDSFAIVDGRPEVTIDIAADAPVTPRTVLVELSPGVFALPTDVNSNQFRVTLPQPVISNLLPIRAQVGQALTLTVIGQNFGSASSINFTPATGIIVNNPPTVSSDGTSLTVTVTIAADAPTGPRVVTVTTPGGVSSSVAIPANTFTLTADAGTNYSSLLSESVGIMVTPAAGNGQVNVAFGPISSAEIGVMVTKEESQATQDVAYTPVVSSEVGVAVGGYFSGFTPIALAPGMSGTFTLYGVGLDAVTTIAIIPADHFTVTDWTPSGDGLSGTVTVSADSAATGPCTLVPLIGTTALPSVGIGSDLLQVGYKPVLNSITTDYPRSSLLAVVGTTVTLTLNGTHLQGVSRIDIFGSEGISIDTVPVWFSDGTGEHVRVTIVVAAGAAIGDRLVQLVTPYGRTRATLDTTNTLSIIKPVAVFTPFAPKEGSIAAAALPFTYDHESLTASNCLAWYGLNSDKSPGWLVAAPLRIVINQGMTISSGRAEERVLNAVALANASRDPPHVIV